MGKRISIYMSDEMLESIQATAKKDGRSVSNYLVQLHKGTIKEQRNFSDLIDIDQSVFSKNDELSEPGFIDDYIKTRPAKSIKAGTTPKLEDIKKQVKKVVARKESTWVNPLAGTACAPRK